MSILPRLAALLCALGCAASTRGAADATAVTWHALDARFPVEGAAWAPGDRAHRFDRLPAAARATVRPEVWTLAQDSAGLHLHFVTDAETIRVRWKLRRSNRLTLSHLPATAASGLDLYVNDAGHWRFVAVARPERPDENERVLVSGLARARREFRLHLPLYNGVESISLGLPPGATLAPAAGPGPARKPIVFYGTSVTQGGCASRPGMTYPALLGRDLDWPVVNLGFSGNAKCEPELAGLLAGLDVAAFVLDPLGNLEAAQAVERIEPFYRALRKRHPETPIVLLEGLNYTDTALVDARRRLVAERNSFLRKFHDQVKAAGDRHVHYVPSSLLLGEDGEDTVDGTHPTDLGFTRMAEGIAPVLREALGLAGDRDAPEPGFVSLFDGRQLGDWKIHDGMPPIHSGSKWWVEDGALAGMQDPPGKGGLLWLEQPFTDFILKFQIKLQHPMDTGVFLRIGPTGLSHQVCLDYRPGSDIGAIFIPFVGHKYVSRFAEGARLVRDGDWNDVTVRMEGEPARIRVWMNGRMLTDFQHTEQTAAGLPASGGIAFQVHPNVENITAWGEGHVVRVRRIFLRELPRP